MSGIRFVPTVSNGKLTISCCLVRGVKHDNEISGTRLSKVQLYSTGFFNIFKKQHIMGKKNNP